MKQLKYLFLIAFVIYFSSCAIFEKARAPIHDSYADTLSVGIYTRVHDGYTSMINSGDKSFGTWQAFYETNLYDIGVLIAYDSTRKHSAAILQLTHDWYNRFKKYELEHQAKSSINLGQAIIYQDGMDNAGKKVYVTESKYK